MSFSKDISRFTGDTKKAHDDITRAATLELFSGVVKSTPVGNPDLWQSPAPPGYVGGRARGSWQTAVGAPVEDDIDRIDPSGASALAEIEANTPPGAGQQTYLVSNLPYIYALEEGASSQAPPGAMVRKNVARVQRIVKAAIAKFRV